MMRWQPPIKLLMDETCVHCPLGTGLLAHSHKSSMVCHVKPGSGFLLIYVAQAVARYHRHFDLYSRSVQLLGAWWPMELCREVGKAEGKPASGSIHNAKCGLQLSVEPKPAISISAP